MIRLYRTIACTAAVLLGAPAAAQCELARFVPEQGGTFGWRHGLALHGETLVVGAGELGGEGRAYVYGGSGGVWVLEAVLVSPNAPGTQTFAMAVDIDGDTIVVGDPDASGSTPDIGSAHVFERTATGWSHAARLEGSGSVMYQAFGRDVAVEDGLIAIGAPADAAAPPAEAVYLFERGAGGWTETARLTSAPDYDTLGTAVDVDGGRVFGGFLSFEAAAGVHVWELTGTGWSLAAVIPRPAQASGRFGYALDADGDTLVVAADADSPTGLGGRVFVFGEVAGAWSVQAVLHAERPVAGDSFGSSVALDGNLLAVGVKRSDAAAPSGGAVELFERSGGTWTRVRVLAPTDLASDDFLGSAAAMGGGRLAVAAPGRDAHASGSGEAVLHDLAAGRAESTCWSTPNSSGAPAHLRVRGDLSVGGLDTLVVAEGCPPGAFGQFFYGLAPAALPLGDGILCISPFSPGLLRLGAPLATDVGGHASAGVDFPSLSSAGAIAPYDVRTFQFWFRDAAAESSGSNLTDAVQVTFCP